MRAQESADGHSVVDRATDRPGDRSPFALGLLLRRAHDRAASALAAAPRSFGLELRHFALLIELAQHERLNQRDLGEAAGMDKAAVVRGVDDLEKAGLAVRRPVPGDRRVRAVEITEKGLAMFDAAHGPAQPIADDLVAHLEPREVADLVELLTKFTHPDVTR